MPSATYPPVPDTVRADIRLTWNDLGGGSVRVMNSIYIRNTVATRDLAYLVTTANGVRDAFEANLLPILKNTVTLVDVQVTDLDTVAHPTYEAPSGETGLVAVGDNLAGQVCAVVQFVGAAGGTPKRSYIRYGPLNEGQASSNILSASDLTDIDTRWTAFQSAITAPLGDAHVIVSVWEPAPRPDPDPTPYRTTGQTNTVAAINVRQRVGRSVSRNR